ncbi:protein lifeguard 1-like [Condylostylus longicornis]|uniref:protein lifeguard 1-like n=1 Tax=Condylostylus longicornis TaxID=2530218 RepID=UPI00244DF66F|nr:protein lifeguard 1-like [Condylostylus longicornis]
MDELDAKNLLGDQLSTDHISNDQSTTTERNQLLEDSSESQKKNLYFISNCQLYGNLQFNSSQKNGNLPFDNNKLSPKLDLQKSSKCIECDTNITLEDKKKSALNKETEQSGILDGKSRKEFMKKVYIVLLMHFITLFGLVSIFLFFRPARIWIAEINSFAVISCFIFFEIFFIILLVGKSYRILQKSILALVLFTITESFLFGKISEKYDTMIIFMTIGLMIGVCISLILFMVQKERYVTVYRCAVLTLSTILVEIVTINMLLDPTTLELVFSSLITIVFSFYMIYDIHLMVNNRHEYSVNPKEYVFAALILNVNVINIPIHISRILNGNKVKQRVSPPIISNKDIVI